MQYCTVSTPNFCFQKVWRLLDLSAPPNLQLGFIQKTLPFWISSIKLASLLKTPEVVAIGECGLDYFHWQTTRLRVLQKEVFDKQATLAHNAGMPLVIHCRYVERGAFQIAWKCLSRSALFLKQCRWHADVVEPLLQFSGWFYKPCHLEELC